MSFDTVHKIESAIRWNKEEEKTQVIDIKKEDISTDTKN